MMKTEDEKTLQEGTKSERRPEVELQRAFKEAASRAGPRADTVHGDGGHRQPPQKTTQGRKSVTVEAMVPMNSEQDKWNLQ